MLAPENSLGKLGLQPFNIFMLERVLILTCKVYENILLSDALRLHNVNIVGTAHEVATAENMVRNLNPDVIIIDIDYKHLDYIEFAQAQRKARGHLGFVFLISTPDLRLLGITESAIPYGSQILLRDTIADIAIVRDAIHRSHEKAATGREYEWFGSHSREIHKAMASSLDELTDAQMETLRLITEGKSNSEIGRIRYVTEKSVEQMVSRIAQQLGVFAAKHENLRVLITREYFDLLSAPKYR